ncbi:uncharacterized protein LOC131849676 [Achroia grisella]|uniref:uncharacterized protein LOC131849676 n=1 Tax=Achroia grisella TaxID=688607 RepID=UPI0027D31294|nr:uncharacterized protein LOC131849676 [Achroia grisella]
MVPLPFGFKANCSNTIVYVATRHPNVVGSIPFTENMPKAENFLNSTLKILVYFITTFLQSLLYIEILLIWIKSHAIDIKSIATHSLGVTFWILKGLMIESALCLSCNMLYQSVSASQLSIYNTNIWKSRSVRRFSKNVLRTQRIHSSKISAFGVFNVDAALPLRMGALITTYTIVLLQFAFL